MEESANNPVDARQVAQVQERLRLEAGARNGISWFYWIAGLSIVNTVIYLMGGSLNFVFGLGATQFVDGFMLAMAEDMSDGTIVKVIGILLDLAITGVFAGVGYLGIKRQVWAIYAGIAFYILDALIFVWIGEWLDVIFHAWVLFSLWRGLQATLTLRKMDQAATQMVYSVVGKA